VTIEAETVERFFVWNRMETSQLAIINKTRETNITDDTTGPMFIERRRVVAPVNTTGWTSLTESLWIEKGIVAMYFRKE
jgi:hypothetical protein